MELKTIRLDQPKTKLLWKIILAALLSRILLLAVGYIGLKITQPGAPGFFAALQDVFMNAGDSPHYIKIAHSWYASAGEDAKYIVFFPLYPMVLRAVEFFVRDPLAAGMLVSLACFSGAACFVYKLAALEFGEEKAMDALFLFLAFPFGIFYAGVFTEGMFVLFTAMGLYYARSRKWIACGIVGLLASLTRIQGVLLLAPAVYELCLLWSEKWKAKKAAQLGGQAAGISESKIGSGLPHSQSEPFGGGKTNAGLAVKQSKPKRDALRPLALLLIPLGAGLYLFINRLVQGDWFAFLKHQAAAPWYNSAKWVGDNLSTHAAMAQQYPTLGMILYWVQLILFFVGIAAILYGLVKKVRSSYLVYGAVYMFATYLHGWLLSGGRYMMACIPLYLVYSSMKSRAAKTVWLLVSALFLALMTILFFQKQSIM